MRKLRALWFRLLHGRRAQDEFEVELESHVAMHTDEGVRDGLSAEEARRQALIRLGGAEQTRQAYRERRGLPWVESLLRDLRMVSARWRNIRQLQGLQSCRLDWESARTRPSSRW